MAKYSGVDSFQISATTTPSRVVTAETSKRFVQNCIIQSPSTNTAPLLIGGPVTQVFVIPAGSSLNLGDLYTGRIKGEVDMYNIWIKSASGTQVANIIHDKSYGE